MRITVVGDVLLDVDLDRRSNAAVPGRARSRWWTSLTTRRRAGGAGLVARMLAQDGHRVTLVTVLSDDDASLELEGALAGVQRGGRALRRTHTGEDPRPGRTPPAGPG